jgi:integrase
MVSSADAQDPMACFLYALQSPISKKYPQRFRVFLRFLGYNGVLGEDALEFLKKARQDPEWVENKLIQFIISEIERLNQGKIAAATIANYYKAVKLFCGMNRVRLDWKIIRRGVPTGNKAANDRAPTLEELQRLVGYPDPRIKSVVYVMVSSGIRLGAWDFLKWGHITPEIDGDGKVVEAKMLVYAGQNEGKKKQYMTRISAEAYNALLAWMDLRKRDGEKITGESWLMRDLWQVTNVKRGANLGLATIPRRFKTNGIRKLMDRALWERGIRLSPEKHHPFKMTHGFRKYFMSHAEQAGMKSINVKILMGHSIGVEDSYYRPEERVISQDYLKAVPNLTISNNNNEQTEVAEVAAQMQSKEHEIQELKENIKSMQEDMQDIFEVLRVVKRNGGRVGTDKTVLDENRNITFYQDYENAHGLHQTVGVKIPIDAVEVEEFQSTKPSAH